MSEVKKLLKKAGLHKSHWGKRIILAETNGFTEQDAIDADNWQTCACGKQDPRIPRQDAEGEEGTPVDIDLRDLGKDFYIHIGASQDPMGAAETLIEIEDRSVEVLQKEANKRAKKVDKLVLKLSKAQGKLDEFKDLI